MDRIKNKLLSFADNNTYEVYGSQVLYHELVTKKIKTVNVFNLKKIQNTDTRSLTMMPSGDWLYKEYVYEIDADGYIIQLPNHHGMIVSQNTFGLFLVRDYFKMSGTHKYDFSYRICENHTLDLYEKQYFDKLIEILDIDMNN